MMLNYGHINTMKLVIYVYDGVHVRLIYVNRQKFCINTLPRVNNLFKVKNKTLKYLKINYLLTTENKRFYL